MRLVRINAEGVFRGDFDSIKLRGGIREHGHMVVPIVAVVERDGDEQRTVLFGGTHKAASGRFGKAGFHADGTVIQPQKLVVIEKIAC